MREPKRVGRELKRVEVRKVGREVHHVGRHRPDEQPLVERLQKEIDEVGRQLVQSFRDEIRSDYYFSVVFQSREQRIAFTEALHERFGFTHTTGDQATIDGQKLAQAMGITLPPGPTWKQHRIKSRFAALARRPPGYADGE